VAPRDRVVEVAAPVAAGAANRQVTRKPQIMQRTLTKFPLLMAALVLLAQTGAGKTFSTPEEARDALIQAAAKGLDEVKTLFGLDSADILRTGDEVADRSVLARFNTLAAEKVELEAQETAPDRRTLLVGVIEWPFAVPLTRRNGRWFWDIAEGKTEIRRRTIGANELTAIEICRGYVDAQRTYTETDWDENGVMEYAAKIISSAGRKDGLYWPGENSPVAAGFAKAAAQGYSVANSGAPRPYHGYYFKILTSQGPAAAGGERDYLVRNLMIGGFGLVAWPAAYGVSGIMTFIVNHNGVVYEKDLGRQTDSLAKAMASFNPDKTWSRSPEETLR
jgi:Protein of unknown function (DUF2950)